MPFRPGQSGNPGGRPKQKAFTEALRTELARAGDDSQALRAIASKLIAMAVGGDLSAIREIADRLEGKSTQTAAISGDDDGGHIRVYALVPAKAESSEAWLEFCAPRLEDKVVDVVLDQDRDFK